MSVNPRSAPLGVGGSLQLTAVAYDAAGGEISGRQLFWASADSSVASVSDAGMVIARKVGAAEIQVVVDGKRASSIITVTPRGVATVAVAPGTASVAAGATTQLQATARDDQGAVLADRIVLWTSSDDNVARVTSTGLVSAVVPGTATIRATSDGKTGTATLTVTGTVVNPGGGGTATVATVSVTPTPASVQFKDSVQLTATAKDAAGGIITGRQVTWTSSNAQNVTVSATGWAHGVRNNSSATVTASIDGRSATTEVTVVPKPVATVRVSGASTVQAGTTTQLTATVEDVSGAALTDRIVTWSSDNTGVATVSATGVVTGVGAGSTAIKATSEGKSGVASVTVVAAPVVVASVTVTPSPAAVQFKDSVQLTAVARDAAGNVVTGRTVTWASNNTANVSVSAAGWARGERNNSSAAVTATIDGRSASTTVSVTPRPVASVSVAPPPPLQVGGTEQLTATPKDDAGTTLTDRTVSWASSNTAVAAVSATGLVTAAAPGAATVTATSEGKSGAATVTVTAVAVATVAVTPGSASVQIGGTQQLTAATRAANGATLTGRAVSWASSNPAVATVNATGLVTAVAAGAATITATSEGRAGTAAITVPQPAVARVAVTPASVTLAEGATRQLTAISYDASDRQLAGVACTWASNADPHATVSATGLVTGVKSNSKGPPIPNNTLLITATCGGRSGTSTIVVQ